MTTNGGSATEPTSWPLKAPEPTGSEPPAPQPETAQADPVRPVPVRPEPVQPESVQPGAGRLIGGRYRLLERLGFGGMGTVWRAHDETVDRDVAVKEPRLPEQLTEGERETAYLRMQREARAAARVDHPSVVTVHDVVTVDDSPWIVMELVRGRSLAEVLQEGTVSAQEAARIGLAVLGALATAHEAGVLHRDVKPANIMVGRHGRVVLTDFGIAQVEGEQRLTETGAFIGSPEYIAPERVLGRRPGPESDLWSLGVVLYQAVEGVSPFRRQTTPSTLQAIVLAELPRAANAGELGEVLAQLLRKEPEVRPSAAALSQALRAVAEPPAAAPPRRQASPIEPASPSAAPERARQLLRGSRRAQLGLGAGALVVALGLVWAIADPFGGNELPTGWKTYQEGRLNASLAAPASYVRSVDDGSVTYADPTKVFTVKFSKWTGENASSLACANRDLAWYKDHYYQEPKPDGTVAEVQQQGKGAGLLDVHYHDTSDYEHPKDQRSLTLDLVSKDGTGYKLELAMPSAAEQAAEGQRMFDQLRANLKISGL
ncbi:serine/threonine-protein kinase [Kitasatospora azatica]|uniref:serine/threonine-protein kinase n=1 Tax=Kitasatospora azatica TaxID=58347 RepID=UPI0005642274|nr:serine/threonine-protein kinase [Kitasatospora azatica]